MTRARLVFARCRAPLFFLSLSLLIPPLAGSAELSQQDYQDRFAQARSLAQQGDLAGAASIYQALIRQAPREPAAYNNLAAIRARQGMLDEAQTLLEQALRNHPDYAAVYENLSAVYVEMARDSYGKALRLDAPPKAVALRELKTASLTQQAPALTVAGHETSPVTAPQTPAVVASVPASKPNPPPLDAPKTTPASGIDQEAVITTLQGWAAAWSEQAVDVYLLFYTRDFSPPGMSRQTWQAQRRARLRAPQWIQVELSNIEVTSINGEQAQVRLVQDYRADNYRDRTLKEFALRLTADGWRISQEQSLSRLD